MDPGRSFHLTARRGKDGRIAVAPAPPEAADAARPSVGGTTTAVQPALRSAHTDLEDRGGAVKVVASLSDYQLASEIFQASGGPVPVLTSRYGEPRGMPLIADGVRVRTLHDAGGVCLIADDPTCLAAGTMLANLTSREIATCTYAGFGEALIDLAKSDASRDGIVLVIPYWDGDDIDPRWVSKACRTLLSLQQEGVNSPIGILTGADAGAFTVAVAKAILAPAAEQYWANLPSIVFDPNDDLSSGVLPAFDSSTPGYLTALTRNHDEAQAITALQCGALVFSGHGRSYCACHGYLCSASALSSDYNTPPTTCHWQMQCAGEDYGRVDPRSYDCAVAVLHSCKAGSTDRDLAAVGIPALALLVAAASPTAVFATHAIAHNVDDLAITGALAGAETAGDAVMRLNSYCRQARLMTVFYLLGDPAVRSELWSARRWFADVSAGLINGGDRYQSVAESDDAALLRVNIPGHAPDKGRWCVYNESEPHGSDLRPGIALSFDGKVEIWLPRLQRRTLQSLTVQARPEGRLPRRMVRAAHRAQPATSGWIGPLGNAASGLVEAADTVMARDRASERRMAVPYARLESLTARRNVAVEQWIRAQERCLDGLTATPKNLWPWNLWDVGSYELEIEEQACDVCGEGPLYRHLYETASGQNRAWTECNACQSAVLRDLESHSCMSVQLDAPRVVKPADAGDVSLMIENHDDSEMCGARCIVVSELAPVQPRDPTGVIRIPAGGTEVIREPLEWNQLPDGNAMRYVFAVVLADLEIQVHARQMVVREM